MSTKQTVFRIEAIWDKDHGTVNEGWYARVHLSDGQERDLPFAGGQSISSVSVTQRARRAAREDGWYEPRYPDVSIKR